MGVVVDPRVRSDRLSALTNAMVLYSSAAGLGLDAVTGPSDTMNQRESYLAMLRSRWISQSAVDGNDDTRTRLIDWIERLLKQTSGPMSRGQAMDRAVELGRVNSACWALSRGDQAMVLLMIDTFGSAVRSEASSPAVLDLSSSPADARWATDARNLTDAEELIGHVDQLNSLAVVGPKSAHALVYLAIQAPNLEVRARAEREIIGRRGEVGILIAIDRIAGAERMTRRMTELVLSYVGDGSSRAGSDNQNQARRLLLVALSDAGVLGDRVWADEFEQHMGELYEVRIEGGIAGSKVARSAADVFNSLVHARSVGGKGVPDRVRAGLLVRLRASHSEIQRSLAYQFAVLELVAEGVRRDHPVQSGRIDRVLIDASSRIQGADDLIVQMAIVERTLAEIWLIVLETEAEL